MKPRIVSDNYGGSTNYRAEAAFALDFRAELAEKLIRHLGIVACEPDGLDSTGRAKLRILTPDEVATRACAIAACTAEIFEARGWIVPIPAPVREEKP